MDEKSNQSRLADKLEQEKLQQQQVQQKKDEREKKRKKIAATLSFENDFDDQGDKRWTYDYTCLLSLSLSLLTPSCFR